jgi:hypothetical protein
LNGLQTFSPTNSDYYGDGCVPLEVLIDYRCESSDFDRLVPQTDATFHYDKFNRLRLRNNVTSVTRTTPDESLLSQNSHLSNETVGGSHMTWLALIIDFFPGSYPDSCSTVHCLSERPALPRHFEYHHRTDPIFGRGSQNTYGTTRDFGFRLRLHGPLIGGERRG